MDHADDQLKRLLDDMLTVSQKLIGQIASAANSDNLAGLWRKLGAAMRQLHELRLLPADLQRRAQQWFIIANAAEKALQERQYELVQRYIDDLGPSCAATVEQVVVAPQARVAASHSAAVVQSPVTTAIEVAEMEGVEHTCPEEGAKAPAPASQVSREYLRALGIPTRRINTWIREGVLLSREPNIFERTPEVHRLITEFLNRC